VAASSFVEPAWLSAVRGKTLLYPSAGRDWEEPLRLFDRYADRFWFADINYPAGLKLPPLYQANAAYQLLSQEIIGDSTAKMEQRQDERGRQYRYLPPSNLREVYKPMGQTRLISVNRRRGFGQYALVKEFHDGEIGIFMHRGDSPGEGGSKVYFLANMNARHEPCGRLFDKLSRKLADRALIITDGSNTHMKRLKALHRQEVDGPEA
jgi:hypothetical protein